MEKLFIKKPYVQRTLVLDKRTVNKFKVPEWHRDFRQAHLARIRNGLKHGNHFSENITLNEVNEHYRIINGNHRIEAIKQIIEDYHDFKVECTATIYKDLNLEEERERFTL